MKKGMPKLSFGFFKDGLKINSKTFHPLNLSLKDLKLESDREYAPIDPMELIESMSNINLEGAAKADKIKTLKTILGKVNP